MLAPYLDRCKDRHMSKQRAEELLKNIVIGDAELLDLHPMLTRNFSKSELADEICILLIERRTAHRNRVANASDAIMQVAPIIRKTAAKYARSKGGKASGDRKWIAHGKTFTDDFKKWKQNPCGVLKKTFLHDESKKLTDLNPECPVRASTLKTWIDKRLSN